MSSVRPAGATERAHTHTHTHTHTYIHTHTRTRLRTHTPEKERGRDRGRDRERQTERERVMQQKQCRRRMKSIRAGYSPAVVYLLIIKLLLFVNADFKLICFVSVYITQSRFNISW